MDNLSRGELGATASTTLTNTTKRSNKTSERASTNSRTCDVKSTGTIFLAMKKKYAGVKSTSKSLEIWT